MATMRILFLAANPGATSALKLDEESREIGVKIRGSEFRDSVELITQWAVRPDDLLQFLNQYRPHIAHFSGHGSPSEEIILTADSGALKPVSKAALVSLFRTLKDNIRVVMLNACYSQGQADAITEVIDCAIGMNKAIGDRAAITFAASFYRALGFGRSVQEAFEQGKTALLLEGIAEESTPQLHVRKGIDPSAIFLVKAVPPMPAGELFTSHGVRDASAPSTHSAPNAGRSGLEPECPNPPRVTLPLAADNTPRSATASTATIDAASDPPVRSLPWRYLTYGTATTTLVATGIAIYLAVRCREDIDTTRPVTPASPVDVQDGAPAEGKNPSGVMSLDGTSTDRDKATPLTATEYSRHGAS